MEQELCWAQRGGWDTHLSGQAEDLLHELLGLCRFLQKEFHNSCQQLQLHLREDRGDQEECELRVGTAGNQMRALKREKSVLRPRKWRTAFLGLGVAMEHGLRSQGVLVVLSGLDLGITTQEGAGRCTTWQLYTGQELLPSLRIPETCQGSRPPRPQGAHSLKKATRVAGKLLKGTTVNKWRWC